MVSDKRERLENKQYCHWEQHLLKVCERRNELELFEFRKMKILANFEKYKYPKLNETERHAIRVIANSLYENIKIESEKPLNMYKQLDEAFVK